MRKIHLFVKQLARKLFNFKVNDLRKILKVFIYKINDHLLLHSIKNLSIKVQVINH